MKKTMLNPLDKHLFEASAVSYATIYRGTAPIDYFRCKTIDVLHHNPWLAGRLMSDESDYAYIEYPEHFDPSHIEQYFKVCPSFPINSGMTYTEIACRIWEVSDVRNGTRSLNKSDVALFRVCILLLKDNYFVFSIAMNHVVGDGATLYKLYSMFDFEYCDDKKLSKIRMDNFFIETERLLGKEQANFGRSFWLSFASANTRRYTLQLKRFPRLNIVQVDKSFVDKYKKNFLESKAKSEDLQFISTNDILTSSILTLNCGIGVPRVIINCRNRMNGLDSKSAGNFITALTFNRVSDSCTPQFIRKSMTSLQTGTVPSAWTILFGGGYSVVNNQCSLYTHIRIPTESNQIVSTESNQIRFCEHVVHFPVKRPNCFWGMNMYAIIFMLNDATIGILHSFREKSAEYPWGKIRNVY